MSEQTADGTERPLKESLRRVLLAVRASGHSVLGRSNEELLQTIVEAAARIFGAAAASIALVRQEEGVLEFSVAYGVGRSDVVGMRIPLGQGIAGYVAMTGLPLAVSHVEQDPRFARETAVKTGYIPRSILAMPLLLHDRVIGVMEVLDKFAAPTFGLQDMELLALFARQAAVAIDQSQQLERMDQALIRGLERLLDGELADDCSEIVQALQEGAEGGHEHDVLALADLFYSIAHLGDQERALGLRFLSALAEQSGVGPWRGEKS